MNFPEEKSQNKGIFLFRHDLRLIDNAGLYNAINESKFIYPIYIYDDKEVENEWKIGEASKWWLHHSLTSLSRSIEKLGCKLILKKGNYIEIVLQLFQQLESNVLYMNKSHEPYSIKRDEILKEKLKQNGIEIKEFGSCLLFNPEEIKTTENTHFVKFPEFWKKCISVKKSNFEILPIPLKRFPKELKNIKSDDLDNWNLLPKNPNWAIEFENIWKPGE